MITLTNIILFLLLISASFKDFTERRIPNRITFPTILIGWILAVYSGGMAGLYQSLLGTAAGIAIFFIPFALGGMGAGDVKLLGAIGALMGWKFVLYSAIYSSIAGLTMSVFSLVKDGNFKHMINNGIYLLITLVVNVFFKYKYNERIYKLQQKFEDKRQGYEKVYIPYGVAISFGALIVWLNEYFAFLPF